MQQKKSFFKLLLLVFLLAGSSSNAQFDSYPRTDYDKDFRIVYTDSLGVQVIAGAFDQGSPFIKGVAVVQNKKGEEMYSALIDKKGKIIIPFANHYIRDQINGLIEVNTTEGRKVFTVTGKQLAQCENCMITYYNKFRRFSMHPNPYDYGTEFKNPLRTVKLFDFSGKLLFELKGQGISPLTDLVGAYPNEKQDTLPYYVITVSREEYRGVYDIVSEKGKVIMDSLAWNSNGTVFTNGIAGIWRKDKYAVIDRNFKQIIPFDLNYGLLQELYGHPNAPAFLVSKNGKYGVINLKNEVLLPLRQTRPLGYQPEYKGYVMMNVNQDSSWTIGLSGDTLNAPGYKLIGDKLVLPYAGIYTDRTTGKTGYINNRTREYIIPSVYEYLSEPVHDSILFFRGDTAGFMNARGKKIFLFPVPCYGAGQFSNGRAICLVGLPEGKAGKPLKANDNRDAYQNKYVWVTKKGEIINNASFDGFAKFENGRAMVNNDGESFFVDTTMKRLKFKGQYDYFSYFREGFAVIGAGANKFGLADEKGAIVVPVIYDAINTKPEQDEASVYRGIPNGIPYMDASGKETSTNGYKYAPDINEKTIIVTKDGVSKTIALPGHVGPLKEPEVMASDTLEQWYTINHDLFIEDMDKEHIPLDGKEVTMIPFRQDSLFGFVSKRSGEWVIKPRFEQVYAVYKEGAIVKLNDSYGFVDTLGKILFSGYYNLFKERNLYHAVNLIYNQDTLPEQYTTFIYNAYYSPSGKLVFEEKSHDLVSFNSKDSLAYFRYGKNYKVRGESGAIYAKAGVSTTKPFLFICNNLLIYRSVIQSKIHYSAYDARNKLKFSVPVNLDGALGPYQINPNLYGLFTMGGIQFIDAKGVIKPYGLERFIPGENPTDFFSKKEFAVFHFKLNKYGVINRKGEIIIPFQYKWIGDFVNGYALYADSLDRYGFIDPAGKKIQNVMDAETIKFCGYLLGKAPAFYDSLSLAKIYCLPKEGDPSTPFNQEEEEESKPICLRYFNTRNETVFTLEGYKLGGYFSDGLAPVMDIKNNFGFINKQGKIVIGPEYEAMEAGSYPMPYLVIPEFKNGFAYIKSYKGYIDKAGKKYFAGQRLQDHYDFSH